MARPPLDPDQETEPIGIRFLESQVTALRREAARQGVRMSELVRDAVGAKLVELELARGSPGGDG